MSNSKIEYKDTKVGSIPMNWEVEKLKQIGSLQDGDWILKSYYQKEGVRLIQIGDIGIGNFLDKSHKFISENNAQKLNCFFVQPRKDILISRMPDPIGRSCIAPQLPYRYIVAVDITILRANKDMVDLNYLVFALNSPIFLNLSTRMAAGATRRRISKKNLENLPIPLPPLPEQQKIAAILGTVDGAIEKVDLAIEKTERLKKGLMQDLLTKGIPSRQQTVDSRLGKEKREFKDTEIGRIPKEWEVVRLGEIVSKLQNGFASGKRDENGVVQIRMNNITTDGRLILDKYIRVPFPANIEEWLLKPGDFLFNNTNSIDLVGKSTIFKTASFPCTYSNHFTLIKIKSDIALPNFVLYNFILLWQKRFFKSIAVRYVGQAEVRREFLVKIKLPLPPLSEQERIVKILTTIGKNLELLRKREKRYQRIKKGLMNDLLTGRRRVKYDIQ